MAERSAACWVVKKVVRWVDELVEQKAAQKDEQMVGNLVVLTAANLAVWSVDLTVVRWVVYWAAQWAALKAECSVECSAV